MRIIADLHIHTGFSRATSKAMTLPNIACWARLKGINLVGTGDFTHPEHFADIKKLLVSTGNGLFVLKEDVKDPDAVRDILRDGGRKAREVAEATMQRVREATGIVTTR